MTFCCSLELDLIVPLFPIPCFMTRRRVIKAGSTAYCAELILLTSIYLLDLLRRRQSMHVIRKSCRYANVLNSGNEAIDKTNMRGQQTKIHYLAISKHTPSSRATTATTTVVGTYVKFMHCNRANSLATKG